MTKKAKRPCVMLFNDIDIVMNNTSHVSFIQNLLDVKTERPFIFTTNFLAKIPVAIRRRGRIDLEREVPLMGEHDAAVLVSSYIAHDKAAATVLDALRPHLPLAPCTIKSLIEARYRPDLSDAENAEKLCAVFDADLAEELEIYESFAKQYAIPTAVVPSAADASDDSDDDSDDPAVVPAGSVAVPAAGPAAVPAAGPAAVPAAGPAAVPAADPVAVPAASPAAVLVADGTFCRPDDNTITAAVAVVLIDAAVPVVAATA